jgi:hypothetical protein
MFINLNFAIKFRILGTVDKFTLLVFFYVFQPYITHDQATICLLKLRGPLDVQCRLFYGTMAPQVALFELCEQFKINNDHKL